MNHLARAILEKYVFEKVTLTTAELQKIQSFSDEKWPVFITVKDGEKVVWSVGRIYPLSESFWEELIKNVILLAEDERFKLYLDNQNKVRGLHFRVDTFSDANRRILHHPDELEEDEGMILLCQKQEKAWVILPKMFKNKVSGEDIYHILIQKIGLDASHFGKWDVILYGLKTEIFEDEK